MDKKKDSFLKLGCVIILIFLIASCGGSGGGVGVIYDGNGNTGGSVPVDTTSYEEGQIVTILGNTGNLVKTHYAFAGWNTQADGGGTTYTQAQTFVIGLANVTLYAKWTSKPTYTVTYDGNGNTGGTVPTDSTNYEAGQTVTILGNTGNLVKTHYAFAGWNTQADGGGTTYTQAQTFVIGSANVTLYAKWTSNPTYTVTYDGNGNTGGSVPTDNTHYEEGATVTVLGNIGNLVKTQGGISLLFFGWNTQSDGNGTTYTAGQTFPMGTENVILYAMWRPPYVLPTSATDISLGANSVLVDGNKVYIIAGTVFKVIDVSNPLSPSLLGNVTHGYTDLRVEAQAMHNNIVWCVRSSSGGMGLATYVFGVDVSNPANPVIRGSLTLQAGTSLISYTSLIYGGYLLVHDYSDNLIYVIDISNPDAPAKYSQWGVPNMVNGGPGLMMIDGTLLYLPCGENRTLRIYNLANLAAVTEVGSVSTGGAEAYGTAVKIGSYVYFTAPPFMKVVDVSNPASPAVVRSVAYTGYLKGRNGKLFSFNGATISAYSLANPIVPVVEDSSTVPPPAPSTSLNVNQMSYPAATWVGNYLVGMTHGSASQYNGARALNFTVN